MKFSYTNRPPGELNTPWDRAYQKPQLIRFDEIFQKNAELERGVTYFIEAIESMGGKTYFSCEGHTVGDKAFYHFYILFSMPYANMRILSKYVKSGIIEMSASVSLEVEDIWRLSLRCNSPERRISELRQLSEEFQSCLEDVDEGKFVI